MKITDVRTTLLTGPSTNDPFFREARARRSAAFIEIDTDAGLTGIGETYAGYFCPEVVPEIVAFFRPILLNQSPQDVDLLWQRMYRCGQFWCRVGLGTSVLTGIEAALYDLLGKAKNVPVWQLLGGCKHEKLPAYATGGPSNYPLAKLLEKVDYYLALGFTGVKLGVGAYMKGGGWQISSDPSQAADFEARKVESVRSHAGGDFGVMLDAHMDSSPDVTWGLETALAVSRALEPYKLTFLEEPLPYNDPWSYSELARSTSLPIAGGECLTALYEWRVFAEQDCFDVGQPDASFTGGLREFMKVAALLDSRGKKIATHAWGAGGSLMQNVHCGFAATNTLILEVPPDYGGLHSEIMGESFRMKDGNVLPPQTPGLGIVLNNDIRNRYPFVPGSGEFNSVPGKVLRD
jgi:L-alanine-DL-glutamate epimerase-like enolase superfamily enzyme